MRCDCSPMLDQFEKYSIQHQYYDTNKTVVNDTICLINFTNNFECLLIFVADLHLVFNESEYCNHINNMQCKVAQLMHNQEDNVQRSSLGQYVCQGHTYCQYQRTYHIEYQHLLGPATSHMLGFVVYPATKENHRRRLQPISSDLAPIPPLNLKQKGSCRFLNILIHSIKLFF